MTKQITDYVNEILTEKRLIDMRDAIAQGISLVYEDATKEGNANMEVSLARKHFKNLASRLDASDDKLTSTTTRLAQTNRNLDKVDTTVNSRIDNIIAPTPTEITEQEIIDARQGNTTLGANLTNIKQEISDNEDVLMGTNVFTIEPEKWESGGVYFSTGLTLENGSRLRTGSREYWADEEDRGKEFTVKSSNVEVVFYFYQEDGAFIEPTKTEYTGELEYTFRVPENAKWVRVVCGFLDNSIMTLNDLETIDIRVYLRGEGVIGELVDARGGKPSLSDNLNSIVDLSISIYDEDSPLSHNSSDWEIGGIWFALDDAGEENTNTARLRTVDYHPIPPNRKYKVKSHGGLFNFVFYDQNYNFIQSAEPGLIYLQAEYVFETPPQTAYYRAVAMFDIENTPIVPEDIYFNIRCMLTDAYVGDDRWSKDYMDNILATVDNYMVCYTGEHLLRSSTNGNTFGNIINVAGRIGKIQYVHLFENGTLLLADHKKVYYTNGNWNRLLESTILDENGEPYTPPLDQENFSSFRRTAEKKIVDGVELAVWGMYSITSGIANTSHIKAWYTSDYGETVRIAYVTNRPDTIKCRHIHTVDFNPYDNTFWLQTGDEPDLPDTNSHWVKGVYDLATDTWSWETFASGLTFKTTNIVFREENGTLMAYWSWDLRWGGVVKAPYETMDDPSTHEQILYTDSDCNNVYVGPRGDILAFQYQSRNMYYAPDGINFTKVYGYAPYPYNKRPWTTYHAVWAPNAQGRILAGIQGVSYHDSQNWEAMPSIFIDDVLAEHGFYNVLR